MKDDPPEEDDVKRYLKKQKELTWRYSQHIADRSIRNANQPPSYDGSEECIDFDCNPDHSQAAFLPYDVIEPGEVTAPMQNDPPEDEFDGMLDDAPSTGPQITDKQREGANGIMFGVKMLLVGIAALTANWLFLMNDRPMGDLVFWMGAGAVALGILCFFVGLVVYWKNNHHLRSRHE